MTHLLAELLSNDHPLFSFNLQQLEVASGHSGVDVQLIADITQKAHDVMRTLHIDTADISAEELYYALKSAAKRDDIHDVFKDTHYVLLRIDDQLVSFCVHDIIENSHHDLDFSHRKFDHAQRHLRAEIIQRYADHDRVDNTLVHHLAEQAGFKLEEDRDFKDIDKKFEAPMSSQKDTPSILMIGDIFTDAFIKLDENYAFVEKDENGKEWLKLPFGSKPPYEYVDIVQSVGPSPNSAVSCARLGLHTSLMAWLGDDEAGKNSLEHLHSEQIDTRSLVTQKDTKSSYWYVLRHGTDRTMLVKSEPYSYEWHDPKDVPQWIYLAYIGADSWSLHEGLLTYLDQHQDIKFVFQPATYHFEWGVEKLAPLYKRAYMTVMNREEAEQVTGKPHDDIHALANGLHELGSNIVVITDGSHGSYASHDGNVYTIPNYPDPAPPIDRTGAGDAFASTLTAGLALGKSIDEALTWAPINSASVVQKLGAQAGLLKRSELNEWLSKAPDDYKVSKI